MDISIQNRKSILKTQEKMLLMEIEMTLKVQCLEKRIEELECRLLWQEKDRREGEGVWGRVGMGDQEEAGFLRGSSDGT